MRIVIKFGPRFAEWSLALVRELRKRKNDLAVTGIVTGTRDLLDYVKSSDISDISSFDYFDEMERKWLHTPLDYKRLDMYETILGPGTIGKIITADRQLGYGLVSGAYIAKTKLISMAEKQENVRSYILGMLDYLFDSIGKDKPSLVFSRGVAGAFAFALCNVCSYYKIPFKRIMTTRVGARYVIDDSYDFSLAPVTRIFNREIVKPSLAGNVYSEAQEYLRKYRENPYPPYYAAYNRKVFLKNVSLIGILKRAGKDFGRIGYRLVRKKEIPIRSANAFNRFKYNLVTKYRARKLCKRGPFEKLGNLPQNSFIYFPLHLEPEASTMVLAPMHGNQTAVIESIAKSMPVRMNLVVKEHITMLGCRPSEFYKRLKQIPGVILVSPFEDSINLIKQSSVTCVITGTAAWEAILLKQPVIVFGNPPFISIGEGFVHCPDMTKLPEALSKAIDMSPVGDDRLIHYLASIFEASFEFPSNLIMGSASSNKVKTNREIFNQLFERVFFQFDKESIHS